MVKIVLNWCMASFHARGRPLFHWKWTIEQKVMKDGDQNELVATLIDNHDIKLITNGMETKDIAWYITHYVTKKQRKSSNTSVLLAKTLAFHQVSKKCTFNLVATNKKLIQCCANTLTHQQELSAPEVVR